MLTDNDLPKKPPFKYNYHENMTIFGGVDRIFKYDRQLDFDVYLESYGVNLQRPFVWTEKQKSELILSMLIDRKIPPITVLVREHKIFKIIDGKQRLGAIVGFYNGDFPMAYEGKKYFYKDLSPKLQNKFERYNIMGVQTYDYNDDPMSDDDLINWFNLINFAGTPQDEDHMNSLRELQQS